MHSRVDRSPINDGSLISYSPQLVVFALAFSVLLGLVCGIYPAFKSSRLSPMKAIRGGDFCLKTGEFVSIIGPSGSGKTALLNMLGCLDAPSSGSLRLNGIEIAGRKERELVRLRRENIGFVFQQFYLMPTLTARENIELPLLFSRKSGSKKRIDEVLQIGGAGRSERSPARTAIGRRYAAGGHRPGSHQRSQNHIGGRAHG